MRYSKNVVMITEYPMHSCKPGKIVGYAEMKPHWDRQIEKWNKLISGKSYLPVEFIVGGNKASVVYPYKFWIERFNYWELGRVHLKLKKKGGTWVITRWDWDLIDTNHSKYDRAFWEKEKKKFLPQKWISNQEHPGHRSAYRD